MNTGMQISFSVILNFFWYIHRSELDGSYSNSIFNFLRRLFTIEVSSFYISTNSAHESQYSISLTILVFFFWYYPSYRYDVMSRYDLDLHFINKVLVKNYLTLSDNYLCHYLKRKDNCPELNMNILCNSLWTDSINKCKWWIQ